MELTTVKLPSGVVVLAHEAGRYSGQARHWANRTQAQRQAEWHAAHGFTVEVWQPRCGPAFYLRVSEKQ